MLLQWGLTRQTAFPCIFHYLFQLDASVCLGECKKTEKVLLQHEKVSLQNSNHSVITIGIQVRDTAAKTAPEHFHCVNSLMSHYRGVGRSVILLLVAVNPAMQEHYKTVYGSRLLLPAGRPRRPQVVSDRGSDTPRHREDLMFIDKIAMQDAARDVYLLSLTDIQVISARSGFGLLGAMSKLSRHHIVYRLTRNEMRNCSAHLEGDPMEFLVHGWSGI
eukprot:CAMPEP_0182433078 /NCGR_PEP_ID=MMETSP1167-20130531/60718_1 /TAXON_ID=2988 /ORGANISM="Mallomonas Sp, Strain CCMP3275" /LENGTH=217 /DNA_ID=CAMNT_0024621303 /DNA_START=263 /DNA_END=916 /DNA_ORIENTATION=+